jgi:hypothetical protein
MRLIILTALLLIAIDARGANIEPISDGWIVTYPPAPDKNGIVDHRADMSFFVSKKEADSKDGAKAFADAKMNEREANRSHREDVKREAVK